MCIAVDQIERAFGLLLLNEFNTFVYYCTKCQCEYEAGSILEVHILSEHQDEMPHIESLFVNDDNYVDEIEQTDEDYSSEQEVENYSQTDELTIEPLSIDIKPEPVEENNEKCEQTNRITRSSVKRNEESSVQGKGTPPVEKKRKFQVERKRKLPAKRKRKEKVAQEPQEENGEEHIEKSAEDSNNGHDFQNESSVQGKGTPLVEKKSKLQVERKRKSLAKRKRKEKVAQEPQEENGEEHIEKSAEESNNGCIPNDFQNESSDKSYDKQPQKTKKPMKKPATNSKVPSKSNTETLPDARPNAQKHDRILFFCDICPGRSFTQKGNLKRHIIGHFEKRTRKTCPICKRQPLNYEKHMQDRHRSIDKLKSHPKIPTGQKSLCSICGKMFLYLKKHYLRAHSGKLPHPCKYCDKTYISPSAVLEHFYQAHSDARPYTCETCGQSYTTKKYLRVHKLFHGKKTRNCKLCDATFYTTESMKFHVKTVHHMTC